MDTRAYRALTSRAALEGKTIGDAVNEAMRAYVGWPGRREKSVSEEYPPGNERLSEKIDARIRLSRTVIVLDSSLLIR